MPALKHHSKKAQTYGKKNKGRAAQLAAARLKKSSCPTDGESSSASSHLSSEAPSTLTTSSASPSTSALSPAPPSTSGSSAPPSTSAPSPAPPSTSALSAPPSTSAPSPAPPSTSASSAPPSPSAALSSAPPSTTSSAPPSTPTTTSALTQATVDRPSASKRKLSYNGPKQMSDPSETASTILNANALQPLFTSNNILCAFCLQPSLQITNESSKNSGIALQFKISCTNCDKELSSALTSTKMKDDPRSATVNRRAVAAAAATGMGYSGLCNFSELMNIPSLHVKTFNCHIRRIRYKCKTYSTEMLSKAIAKVKTYYEPNEDGTFDIDVSYDGTWHKRGHTSKTGIGCVIEVLTGLVIDYQVLTSYCAKCSSTGAKLKKTNLKKYQKWYDTHKPFCHQNYVGTSGGMEKEAAVIMWNRSLEKHGVRYKTLVSDGDSKTFAELQKSDPYPGIVLEKIECINHVAKRLGTHLRKLVKDKSKAVPKVTLGGKGYGKLRPDIISKLQKYYSNAVRNNSSVVSMQAAIMATLYHCASTDEDPQHHLCPSGEDSWCFYQRAIAQGIPVETLIHEDLLTTPLTKDVVEHIKPVYEFLSDPKLLYRCLSGSTQNANESLHSVIWARCPKHLFACANRVNISAAIGVGEFNFGARASQDFLSVLELPVGCETERRGLKRDHLRVYKAELTNTEKFKKWRQTKKEAKEKDEERLKELFGEFYVPGGCD